MVIDWYGSTHRAPCGMHTTTTSFTQRMHNTVVVRIESTPSTAIRETQPSPAGGRIPPLAPPLTTLNFSCALQAGAVQRYAKHTLPLTFDNNNPQQNYFSNEISLLPTSISYVEQDGTIVMIKA